MTRVNWMDGRGEEHQSLPIALYWFGGVEWVAVICPHRNEPRWLRVFNREQMEWGTLLSAESVE